MDAEEVGDVLDRVSIENALDGEEPTAHQFRSRARGSHTIHDSSREYPVALFI